MKIRLSPILAVAVAVLFFAMTAPGRASTILDDPQFSLQTSATGDTSIGAGQLATGIDFSVDVDSSSDNIVTFTNDTGVLWTDLHITTISDPTKNANSYNCDQNPAFFTTCTVATVGGGASTPPDSVTWDFFGLGTGIGDGTSFALKLTGFDNGESSYHLQPTYGASTVPEPASLLLLGSGLAGLAGLTRRRRPLG